MKELTQSIHSEEENTNGLAAQETQPLKAGTIHVTNDVVSKIAAMAAQTTVGIASMSAGLSEGIAKSVLGKGLQKGIDIKMDESGVSIYLRVVVAYGCKMHEVCRKLQQNVCEQVQDFTGLNVNEIRVHVVGVSM